MQTNLGQHQPKQDPTGPGETPRLLVGLTLGLALVAVAGWLVAPLARAASANLPIAYFSAISVILAGCAIARAGAARAGAALARAGIYVVLVAALLAGW